MKFDSIKAGEVYFTVTKQKAGNTTMSTVAVHRVRVISTDTVRQTVKAAELPGSAGGFTMGVWRAGDVPVGSEVGIVSAPVASATPSGELPPLPWQAKENHGDLAAWLEARSDTEIANEFSEYGQDCYLQAIAHHPPEASLTDGQIGAIFDNLGGYSAFCKDFGYLQFAQELLDAAPVSAPTAAATDVLAERRRQIEAEGWTPESDDEYETGELAQAAASYAANFTSIWPFRAEWWKPTTERRNLVKAGALILAEIERIDRATAKGQQP